ncbi:MAG: glycosyltransferase family 39 protein [Bryobacteraceae bacterium]
MRQREVRAPEAGVLCSILILLAAALALQASRLGLTVDEPGHLVSAHLYWLGADSLLPGDMPPLIQIVGGWPSLFFDPPVPRDNAELWNTRQESPIGSEMLMRMSDTPGLVERYVFASRLPLLVFPLLTAALVWWWGRWLFAPWVGVLAAALFALEPTAAGHGSLFKNDLAATCTYLFFWYRAWRFWREPACERALRWMGVALGIALLSKLSMAVLIPIGPAIAIARRSTSPRAALGAAGSVLAAAYAILAVAYQSIWPAAYWRGLVSIWHSNADGGGVYLWGRVLDAGHPLYFPAALAVKIPVPLQLLLLIGAIAIARRWVRPIQSADWLWLFPPALYIGFASMSNLQLGVRLILPALPFGLLIAGAAVAWLLRTPARMAALAAMLLWMAGVSAGVYPFGISFFNAWAGGPAHALDFLADSNVDWGQGLPALARFTRQHGIAKIRLSYFGLDNPWRFFREEEIEFIPPPWEPSMARGAVWEPDAGYYAISASLLPGFLFQPPYRGYYAYFRDREPLARVAHSIYVYRVGAVEVSAR